MAATLADDQKEEAEAKATYDQMMAAKTQEVNTLAEDTQYLAELKKGCATKEAEWEARCKVRAEEIVALSETITALNDDDALELFKKTLPAPSASFVQIQQRESAMRARALEVLRSAPKRGTQIDLVMLALNGKKIGFEKVIKLIDEMMVNLKKEQSEDDA